MTLPVKLSHLIAGQLPEFVRSEYPMYVKFIEAYYRFLEEDGQVHNRLLQSVSWSDIDKTLDIFVPEFRKQFAPDVDAETLVDVRRLIKLIGSYYESKGSEESTKLFFQMFFDTKTEFFYPGQYIFKASDGRWVDKVTIKMDATAFPGANPFELAGRVATFKYRLIVPVEGDVIRSFTGGIQSVRSPAPRIFEMEVDIPMGTNIPIEALEISELAPSMGAHDSHIYVQLDDTTYGTLTKQIVSVSSIDNPGVLFLEGEVYEIVDDDRKAHIQIFRTVDNDAPGMYFALEGDEETYFETDDDGYFNDLLPRKIGMVKILTTGYRFPRLDTDVQMVITPYNVNGSPATITFNLGYLRLADGRYISNAGFPSDIYKLQDNHYYQPYSYVIKTPVPSSKWAETLKNTTHPAGMTFFPSIQNTSEMDIINPNIESDIDVEVSPIVLSYVPGDELLAFGRNSTATYDMWVD